MRKTFSSISILMLAALACQSLTTTPAPADPLTGSATQTVSAPQATAVPAGTSTPTALPEGVIFVDTLEQEAYPFAENGKCSLAEAIIAANTGEPKDTCAAGVPGKSVISLMPGEYHFTQPDQSPPQFDWLVSLREVGSALPLIYFPLTIQGNGATLIRDDGSEPFRFFEVMVNSSLSLNSMTLQGGDVGEDWGGAMYTSGGSINLADVHFINNHADLGGAIYFDLGGLTIKDSEFRENHSTRSGGALFITSSKATIESSRFEGNVGGSDGGAVTAETVTIVITDSIFLRNRVTGENYGTLGGGLELNHVNLNITRSQFYQNESPMYGGAIAINNPILAGIDPEEGDPIEQLEQSPVIETMLTSIPGFQATLEAHPSGVFVNFNEDAQIHNNCFANNITINPGDPNWTSALLGRASVADNNYWGDPSGPGGMGPGSGDNVGKRLTFQPWLTEKPNFCDPTLATQE